MENKKTIAEIIFDMPGVCDGCWALKETRPYSFDSGDVELCDDCTTEPPYFTKLYDQHVEDMKRERLDSNREELRMEELDRD